MEQYQNTLSFSILLQKVQAQEDAHVPLLGFSGDREMAQWGKHLLCMQEN